MKVWLSKLSVIVEVGGGEAVSEGTVAQIRCVDTSDNSVQIHADDIDDGYCWVHVSKVRKYRKEQVTTQEHHVFSTGDVVQVLSSHINRHNEALSAGAVYRVLGKGSTHGTVILRVDGYMDYANVATTEIKLVCKAGDYEDVTQE